MEVAHPQVVLRLSDSWSNWNLEMLVLRRGENQSTRRKTSRSKGENQQENKNINMIGAIEGLIHVQYDNVDIILRGNLVE